MEKHLHFRLKARYCKKRQIADALFVGMPIEAYIEPLNLKLSEYKFALPNNPSQTIKQHAWYGRIMRE